MPRSPLYHRLLLAPALALLAACTTAPPAAVTAPAPEATQEEAAFAAKMAEEHGFDAEAVRRLLAGAQVREDILAAISRPAEGKPWSGYRPIFLTTGRIEQGAEFWLKHGELLDQAASRYGVRPEIIVAILGVETRYGQHAGKYPVLDSLVTLGFHYPPRAAFFRSELEQFLLLTREEGLDPKSVLGSYAGAMGQAQFISSSYRHYAVDFDHDGHRDLMGSTADAVGSVAAYFHEHGWRPGEPVAVPARVTGTPDPALAGDKLKPTHTVAELRAAGVQPSVSLPGNAPATLITLEGENGPEYWVGLQNFYVITRYNRSPLYAMAVYQLSQAILDAMGPTGEGRR